MVVGSVMELEGGSISFPPGALRRVLFWNVGIFFIHGAYGIDVKLILTLDSTVSAKERDTDGFNTFPIHTDSALSLDRLTGISQDEIFQGNEDVFPLSLVFSEEETVLP